MNSSPTLSPTSTRFVLVDALRGIAALAVVLHHCRHATVLTETLSKTLPDAVSAICGIGACGVQIFFVLSGFVIAHSLRHNPLNRQSVGNFMLRRQIRLDPPYWMLIVLTLGQQAIERRVPSLVTPPLPGPTAILANFFYLQYLLGLAENDRILDVAWTLCLEIQFYILFILLLAAGRRGQRPLPEFSFSHFSIGLIFVSGVLCLGIPHNSGWEPWFFFYWHYFAAGVLCYCAWQQMLARRWIMLFLGLFFVRAMCAPIHGVNTSSGYPAMLVGLAASASLLFAGRHGGLTSWGNYPILQYLGRISYSLYLVHLPVLRLVTRIGFKLTKENPVASVIWITIAFAVSVGLAHIFHNLIEKPSVRLASRLKEKRSESSQFHPVGELSAQRE